MTTDQPAVSPHNTSIRAHSTWRIWLDRALWFMPAFRKRGFCFRAVVSMVLLVFLAVLPAVKFDQNFKLLVAAVSYNPEEHAQDLYEQGKKLAAHDFIDFYLGIPGVSDTEKLKALDSQIQEERGSWNYRLTETWKGLSGDESEEVYGKAVEFVTEFTAIGDMRALYVEGGKAMRGEEIDALNASMATLGLGMTLASIGPQAPAVAPVKSFTGVIKKSSAVMSPGLKKGILKAFDPLLQFMKKSKDVVDDAGSALAKGKMGVVYYAAKKVGREAAQHVKDGAKQFTDFITLAGKNPRTAIMVARYSDDVPALTRNAKLVTSMGDDAGRILAHGGKKSLQAAETLQKGGNLSGDTLKKAMQYGESGLEWLRHSPLDELIIKVRSIRLTASGKAWYYMRWLLSLIPLPVVLLLMGLSGLTLFNMWIYRPLSAVNSVK